jgi:ribosomal protein L35
MKSRRKSGAAFASHPISGSRRLHRRHAGTTEVATSDRKRIKRMLGI